MIIYLETLYMFRKTNLWRMHRGYLCAIIYPWYELYSSFNVERVDRIKEAKSEAEALIAAYRAEMEANFQKKMNLVLQFILHLLQYEFRIVVILYITKLLRVVENRPN